MSERSIDRSNERVNEPHLKQLPMYEMKLYIDKGKLRQGHMLRGTYPLVTTNGF